MKKPRRILVGLKTNDNVVELTDVACRIAARNASVLLVHVIELPDVTPLDADIPDLESEGRTILKRGARVVGRAGLKVDSLLLRAHDAGSALLDEIRQKKIELAVLVPPVVPE